MVETGELPVVRIGARVGIPSKVVEEWVAQHTEAQCPTSAKTRRITGSATPMPRAGGLAEVVDIENQRRADSHRKRSRYAAKTFNDVMEFYLTNHPTERGACAVKALLPHFTCKPIQIVTAADIAAYKASRGVSYSPLAKELGTLRAAIRFCNREYD